MYRVLRWVEEGVGAKRKSGSGRPAVKLPPKQANTMIKEILCKVEVLHAKMGRKYGVHRTMIGKSLLQYLKKGSVQYIKLRVRR